MGLKKNYFCSQLQALEPYIFLSHTLETESLLPPLFVLIIVKEMRVSLVLYMYMYIPKHFIQAPNSLLQISKFHRTSKQQKEKKKSHLFKELDKAFCM